MKRLLRNNGLSLVLLSLFFSIWIGQSIVGWQVYNEQQQQRSEPEASLFQYLRTGHFVEATAENWESEFLQMGAFVWLTTFLFQNGSPESNDPDKPEPEPPLTPDSPWPARAGGWIRALYAHSLSLAFLAMFAFAFVAHASGGAREYSAEQMAHGEPPVTVIEYLGTWQFWFESLQNWQSEFLAIAAMVILTIFLRERNSPESKPVPAPHSANE
jgi:hypothetical protein